MDGYTREKDERTTENKMEIEPMQSNETWKSTGLRASEMVDMATMSRKITSHTGDPLVVGLHKWENNGGNEEE